ncbi:helix-turn-helix transcriptional regulator [Burkholderia cenocepacia]|uniref:helix-turn-helix domain-containing protein n=1 Tax=Burkholderia cepacia complex TaxID=87882 RepID=UPI001040E26E|nr:MULTISPECIES: helix-turn-helix transcriptional regulator [Burkholderia cepacia complex]MBH9724826.1 helix-turn-helix transcriptional regulator [Burkholderia contaminans]MBR8029213.1 helix-turn-helix transcriptional regulator [Burkholderia cenocepacia]MBR8094185.1 helix-turn-helix transcriptional regulator [Burkholderia cenocepacia]MBR8172949.1 helix-turn-helix transcriptional regulator [Burkholderia cenocepacia]MBY4710669.1 helix-turn-helix domain-containing protein [Burkholderia cepacia]
MTLAELGETFRQARMAANLTQQQVAVMSGVTRGRISMFETGMLPEIGAVKLLALFNTVGLELIARRPGHQRTLDDVLTEPADSNDAPRRQRVRTTTWQRLKATEGKS